MFNKAPKIFTFIYATIFALLVFCENAKALDDFKITDFNLDKSGNVLLLSGKNSKPSIEYTKVVQSIPAKMIIDVSDSILVNGNRKYLLNQAGIKDIEISQISMNPYAVRISINADTDRDLNKIGILKTRNSIALKIGNINENVSKYVGLYKEDAAKFEALDKIIEEKELAAKAQKLPTSSEQFQPIEFQLAQANVQSADNKLFSKIDTDINIIITSVRANKNHILISGVGGISFKEPLMLTSPTRVVFDFPGALVEKASMIKNITLLNGDIVRTGQFDEDTFRVVVETKTPDKYRAIVSSDAQTVAITHDNDASLYELADIKTISALSSLKVSKKGNGITFLNFSFTNPIIHSIERADDGLYVELADVKTPVAAKLTNLTTTAQFKKIQAKAHPLFANGSIFFIPLKKGVKIQTSISKDGKEFLVQLKEYCPVKTLYNIGDGRKIILDAGHGGCDPGASQCSIFEKDINLDVTKRIEKYLKTAGVGVIMTRDCDKAISLSERSLIANSISPDAFVSIHVNSTVNSKIRGVETHYYNEQSLPLAKVIHSNFANSLNTMDRGIMRSMFYVIHHTQVPSVLVEIGFLSNANEKDAMMTEKRKDATAKAIANGILTYLAQENKRAK